MQTNKRRLMKKLCLALAAMMFPIGIYAAEPTVPEGVEFQPNLTYSRAGDEDLRLDLARPKQGHGPFPAMVYVHGGGWSAGSRTDYHSLMLPLARRGIVGISVDYRLTPKHRFPAPLEDVKAAVRWLRANAAKYNVDPDRIGAIGGSAGAHLVALLGTTAAEQEKVSFIVCHGGPYDLELGYRRTLTDPTPGFIAGRYSLEKLIGGPLDRFEQAYRQASPIHHVSKNTPPVLLIHGSLDKTVPVEQAQVFYRKLQELGVESQLVEIADAGHSDFGQSPDRVSAQMFGFLAKHLLPTNNP